MKQTAFLTPVQENPRQHSTSTSNDLTLDDIVPSSQKESKRSDIIVELASERTSANAMKAFISKEAYTTMNEEFRCPICRDILTNP